MAATVALYEMTRRSGPSIGSRRHDRSDRAAARARPRRRSRPPARATRSRSCACATSAARPSCRRCCARSPTLAARAARRGRQGRQPGAPGARGADRGARRRARAAPSSSASSASDRVDVTLPGAPPQPIGRLHVLSATRRELEDIFLGLGFTVMEGPEVETVHYNFDALNHSPTHPARARTDTFYVSVATGSELVLRTHTSPMQVRAMEAHPPPLYVVDPRPRLPARLRRHAHAAVPPDRGSRRRRGHHARRPEGHAAALRPRRLRRRARRAPAPALLPLHRAERRGRRVLLSLRAARASCATARAATCARARAGSRCSAPARSTPTSTRYVPTTEAQRARL